MLKSEPNDIDRRLKILLVGQETMLDILRGRIDVDIDLPDDAAVRAVEYSFSHMGFMLLIWSYAFEPVARGYEIPRLPPFVARVNNA